MQSLATHTKKFLISLVFISSSVAAQDIQGSWLFYDVAKKEKFSLYLPRITRSYAEIPYQTYGARSLEVTSTQPTLKYRVRGRDVSFFHGDTGALFMSGALNADATEITGSFYKDLGSSQQADGVFVAQKQDPGSTSQIYQVIYLAGRYQNAPNCVAETDKDSAYSIDVKCAITQGVSRMQARRSRGSPANWLSQPNTFLSEQACLKKLEEIRSASLCSDLCSTPLCWSQ